MDHLRSPRKFVPDLVNARDIDLDQLESAEFALQIAESPVKVLRGLCGEAAVLSGLDHATGERTEELVAVRTPSPRLDN
jgi:hypothetical protein